MLDWKRLAQLSDEELGQYDIAEVNLACAAGLPGSEAMDVDFCLRKTGCVRALRPAVPPSGAVPVRAAARRLQPFAGLFQDAQHGHRPAARLRGPLQRGQDPRARAAGRGGHVHLRHLPGGGWHLRLAAGGLRLGGPPPRPPPQADFRRGCEVRPPVRAWDGQGEHFNVEATNKGVNCYPDDHYRTGFFQLPPGEEEYGCHLRPKMPREELSSFLADRGLRWLKVGKYRQAVNTFAWSLALQPANRWGYNRLGRTLDAWAEQLRGLEPPGFPEMYVTWPPRRFPAAVPEKMERDIIGLEAWENLLKDPEHEQRWWGPMRGASSWPSGPRGRGSNTRRTSAR